MPVYLEQNNEESCEKRYKIQTKTDLAVDCESRVCRNGSNFFPERLHNLFSSDPTYYYSTTSEYDLHATFYKICMFCMRETQ